VPGLYAAGELAGGANGANRLSGNAIPEAIVFGERAGEAAAKSAKRRAPPNWDDADSSDAIDQLRAAMARDKRGGPSPVRLMSELKSLMWRQVGAFRNADDLLSARDRIRAMRQHDLDDVAVSAQGFHNAGLVEWFELRNGLLAAEAVALGALCRRESRGAHQRTEFPETNTAYQVNQRMALAGDELVSSFGDGR
jgi:succinate dehydrogenase/fumarate reductase flavoprotein subunit